MSTPSSIHKPLNGEDRAKALLQGLTGFVRRFRSPGRWPTLSDQDLQHMAFLACLTYQCHPERTLRMHRMFAEMARRLGVLDRFRLLGTVTAFIEEGRATAEALMPFVFFEESGAIVAAASREYALLHQSPMHNPVEGAERLLNRLDAVQALPSRMAPVMAGLVGLGDLRLAPVLKARMSDFCGPAARGSIAYAEGAFATRLHTEFLLTWLERAACEEDAIAAVHALRSMPTWAMHGKVSTVSRVFPSTAAPAGEELSVTESQSFAEALVEVRPRLAVVALLAELRSSKQACATVETGKRLHSAIQDALRAWSAVPGTSSQHTGRQSAA